MSRANQKLIQEARDRATILTAHPEAFSRLNADLLTRLADALEMIEGERNEPKG